MSGAKPYLRYRNDVFAGLDVFVEKRLQSVYQKPVLLFIFKKESRRIDRYGTGTPTIGAYVQNRTLGPWSFP